MISINNPDYWSETSLLRVVQGWNLEKKAEKQIVDDFLIFLEQVKREVGDLYAEYSVEGLLDYAKVNKKINSAQLEMYRRLIEQLILETKSVQDEEYRLELEKLYNTKNMTILGSRMNIVEAYLLVLLMKVSQTVTESLFETYNNIYNHTIYDAFRKFGFAFDFEKLTRAKIKESILSDWWGDTFIDAIKAKKQPLIRDIKRTIVKGIRRNEAYKKVVKNLSDLIKGGKGYKSAHRILREETNRVMVESKAQAYEQAGIEKYQYVATLDDKTTVICRGMDGNIYPVSEMQVGVNAPNMHFGCRSTVAPYIDDDDLSKLERVARDPVTKQNYKVPANLSYSEWDRIYNN